MTEGLDPAPVPAPAPPPPLPWWKRWWRALVAAAVVAVGVLVAWYAAIFRRGRIAGHEEAREAQTQRADRVETSLEKSDAEIDQEAQRRASKVLKETGSRRASLEAFEESRRQAIADRERLREGADDGRE